MSVRGIRGAIQIEADTVEAIYRGTHDLLQALAEANPGLAPQDLASANFSLTDDLTAAYPAQAARDLPGWEWVPLFCSREIRVPDGLPRCLRILLHWNTDLPQQSIQHIYLGPAAQLRPDVNGRAARLNSAQA